MCKECIQTRSFYILIVYVMILELGRRNIVMRVEVKNLHKTYGQKCAVEDVSLSLESGKVCSIIGRNGSGKTSTIRMMS